MRRLEPRTVLAFGPIGPEFLVNTGTAFDQLAPSVAADADGNFVVAWESFRQDGSQWGAYAQRFNANGEPVGEEFRVNTTTGGNQAVALVASDADGDFVVAWTDSKQDGSDSGVYAQRFSRDGEPAGGEFRVNTATAGRQLISSIAIDAAGGFVIAWSSPAPASGPPPSTPVGVTIPWWSYHYLTAAAGEEDGSGFGVHAQRYGARGQPVGLAFQANTTTSRQPVAQFHALAMDADGDFVIAWGSSGQDGVRCGRLRPALRGRECVGAGPRGAGLRQRTRPHRGHSVVRAGGLPRRGGGRPGLRVRTACRCRSGPPGPLGRRDSSVSIRFNRDVADHVERGDLAIRGVARSAYTPTAFAYDAATRTATWTLPAAVLNDRLGLFLDEDGVGGLDGEWQNADAAET